MMKLTFFILSLVFGFITVAQDNNFSKEELSVIKDKKSGSGVWMDHDLVKDEIEFRSTTCSKVPLTAMDYAVILRMRCYVVKVNGEVCLKSIKLKQRVTKSGVGVSYDKITFLVGTGKDKKNGDVKKYSFAVQTDGEGVSFIADFQIFELFKYAIDNYKPIEIHFINSVSENDVTYNISTSKVKTKFKGLIETFENLKKEYSECTGNGISDGETIEGDFVLTKDEFYERTFYKHSILKGLKRIVLTTNGSVAFYLYFSVPFNSQKAAGLRLYVMYHGDDWIFFDRIIVLIDGTPIEIKCEPETETLSGNGIVEFTDVSVIDNPELYLALTKMTDDSVIKVRLTGKYKHDYTLQAGVREAFLSTFKKYLELGGIAFK